MNQTLKSLFMGIYPLLAFVGVVLSVDQYLHDYTFAAIGLFLIAFSFLFFLGTLFLTDIARTDSNLTIYSIFVGIGLLVLVYAFYMGQAEWMAAIGFLLALCWALYIKWYSTFGDRSNAQLNGGKALPYMLFKDENGDSISSNRFIGKKNILMFYRGNWCPLCMTQIKELVEAYKELESKGIQTILISPQPHRQTKKLAEKFDVAFKFLVDKDNAVARQLNIVSLNGLPTGLQALGYDSDTVMPTVILTNKEGKILHSDLTSNYRVRPEPEELIGYFG